MSYYSCSAPEDILNSQLNCSVSKFHYSFPKARRFIKNNSYCQQAYYDRSSYLNLTGTVIGNGQRSDFTRPTSVAPPVTLYNISSLFEKNILMRKGSTFGESRDKLTENSYITQGIIANPGVGQYHPKNKQKKIAYSLRMKTQDSWLPTFLRPKENLQKSTSPGPANYSYFDFDMYQGKPVNAKYKSAPQSSLSKSQRFSSTGQKTPGPTQYTIPDQLNDSGQYRISRHNGNGKRFMAKAQRKSFIDNVSEQQKKIPGPGQYRQPSEFGHYDNFYISNKSFYKGSRPTTSQTAKRPIIHD